MTPPRLVKLRCPKCQANHWEIEHDYRGSELVGRKELSYADRIYRCPDCGIVGTGYVVEEQSPPAFFLQPLDGPSAEATRANTEAALAYCLAQPQWRLSLQTHKLLGIR